MNVPVRWQYNFNTHDGEIMSRMSLVLAVGVGIGFGGMTVARHDEKHNRVKVLSEQDIAEKIDSKEAKATAVEATLEPGQAGDPHRHPGPTFSYVLEGEYEWAIDEQPAKRLKVGDTFHEPAGCLHRVSKNPGKVKARVLAWVLHPRDAKELVIPEPKK